MIDHDRLFKELLTTFFVEFLELFLAELAADLERATLVFIDKEVFTDVTSGQRHEVDVLARVRFRDDESCFLIHVENQAQAHSDFAERMFGYFARLREKYHLPVYPKQQLIAGFIDTYLRLSAEEELQFLHQSNTFLSSQEKERVMELTTSWEEKGLQQGLQQGRREGEANVVLRQLRRRCGDIPAVLAERVSALPLEQLETLADALLDFTALSDLERFLNR